MERKEQTPAQSPEARRQETKLIGLLGLALDILGLSSLALSWAFWGLEAASGAPAALLAAGIGVLAAGVAVTVRAGIRRRKERGARRDAPAGPRKTE